VIVREISLATDQTESFFHALAPALVANVLTVVFVYCFAMINQREKRGEEGRLSHLWLIVILMLCGLYFLGHLSLQKDLARVLTKQLSLERDGSGLASRNFTSRRWPGQPCVRPVSAVRMTAGHMPSADWVPVKSPHS
jgi:hypothetical protein